MDVIQHVCGTQTWYSPFCSLANINGDYENFSKTQAGTTASGATRPQISTSPARISGGHRLGALAADRTSCTRPAQITEHDFTKARRLRQRPDDRTKSRLSQAEEGPHGTVPRLPNWGSG